MDKFFCKASTDRLKIQTAYPESYRALVRYLKDQDAQFHTYQLREDKSIRVVLRNLHPSTDVNKINEELELRLFEVRNVTNVLHKVTKNPLPLFFVDLEPSIKSKKIFNCLRSFILKLKLKSRTKQKLSANVTIARIMVTRKHTGATLPVVSYVVMTTNLPTVQTNVRIHQNVPSAQVTTQLVIKVVLPTRIYSVPKNQTPKVII
jgi:hypothetical protein